MRRCGTFFLSILLFNTIGIAQIIPTPTSTPTRRPANVNPILGDNENYDRLRAIEMMGGQDRPVPKHPLLDPKKGIYRNPSKEEVEVLAVGEPLLAKHAEFLKGRNTGIVKLSVNSSCLADTGLVIATEQCIPFKMPGAGTAFSFRTESYRLPRLADVILHNGIFKTGGAFQQVIMVDLGDVEIEGLTLNTNGVKYLADLKPVRDSNEFTRYEQEIIKGFEVDGHLYRKGHLVKENSTFVLRSIAYRGRYIRSLDGIEYDEMAFDKRRDVIVAFRVVERDAAGNITILWNRMKDVEAPVLKIVK